MSSFYRNIYLYNVDVCELMLLGFNKIIRQVVDLSFIQKKKTFQYFKNKFLCFTTYTHLLDVGPMEISMLVPYVGAVKSALAVL